MDTCNDNQIIECNITDSTMIDDKYVVVKRLDCNEIA